MSLDLDIFAREVTGDIFLQLIVERRCICGAEIENPEPTVEQYAFCRPCHRRLKAGKMRREEERAQYELLRNFRAVQWGNQPVYPFRHYERCVDWLTNHVKTRKED